MLWVEWGSNTASPPCAESVKGTAPLWCWRRGLGWTGREDASELQMRLGWAAGTLSQTAGTYVHVQHWAISYFEDHQTLCRILLSFLLGKPKNDLPILKLCLIILRRKHGLFMLSSHRSSKSGISLIAKSRRGQPNPYRCHNTIMSCNNITVY